MARMAFAQSAMRPQRSLPARENALKSDGYNVAVIHDPIRVFVGGIYVDGLRNDASHAEVAGMTSTASTSLGRTSTASTSLGRTSTVPKRTSTTSTSLEWMSQLLGWTSAVSLLDANRAWTTANRVDAP